MIRYAGKFSRLIRARREVFLKGESERRCVTTLAFSCSECGNQFWLSGDLRLLSDLPPLFRSVMRVALKCPPLSHPPQPCARLGVRVYPSEHRPAFPTLSWSEVDVLEASLRAALGHRSIVLFRSGGVTAEEPQPSFAFPSSARSGWIWSALATCVRFGLPCLPKGCGPKHENCGACLMFRSSKA